MKNKIIAGVLIVGVVVVGGFVLKNNKDKMKVKTELAKKVNATIPVQVSTSVEESLSGGFTATGNFTPYREVVVSTETAGKILNLQATEGQFVKMGQLLARLEYGTLEAEVKSASANLKKLETDKERYEKLVVTGGVTQSQLDDITLAYVNAESRLVTAKEKLNDTYITAPFAGYVNKRFVENGQYIASGKEAFEIVELARMKMVVNVTEDQVLAVNKAKEITVTADVYSGVTYQAKVKFIGAKADASLNFPVELEITNIPNNPLRGGMFGRASFELPVSKTSLVIPRAALLGSIENAQVYVVSADSVILKQITIGQLFSNKVEILKGLAPGEKVVTSGQINLSDGAKITIQKEN